MANYRTIEIDFDIHKRIELERTGFEETPNAVLRRLLGLPSDSGAAPARALEGKAWEEEGVILPHGCRVRMYYDRGRQFYEGQISNGRWMVAGRVFDSPSGAASELATTKKGEKTKLNGWNYFEVRTSDEEDWTSLRLLRAQASGVENLTLTDLGL